MGQRVLQVGNASMSRVSLTRLAKLETARVRLSDISRMKDEELIAVICDYDSEKLDPALAEYRRGGLEAIVPMLEQIDV